VITHPRRSPGRTPSLASSIDLGSTLMDLCDVAPHDGVQGRSLVPVLDDPNAAFRDHVLIEDGIRSALDARRGLPTRTRTIVSDEGWKYTRNGLGETMLFDLPSDPDELHELGHLDVDRRARADSVLVEALMNATDEARGAPVG